MLGLLVVLDHVRLDVSAAHDHFAFEAYPVFFGVAAISAWSGYCQVLELFDWSDVLTWKTMRTFFDGLAGIESHDRPWLCIDFWDSFAISGKLRLFIRWFTLSDLVRIVFFGLLLLFFIDIQIFKFLPQLIYIDLRIRFLSSFIPRKLLKVFRPSNLLADLVDNVVAFPLEK